MNQSQTVNNFFSFASIVIISVVITLYMKYIVKPSKRLNSGLPCQKVLSSKDNVINQRYLSVGYGLLQRGLYVVEGGVLSSPSEENDRPVQWDIIEIDRIFYKIINTNLRKSKQHFLKIKYEVIEYEEKKDSMASLMTSFRINNKETFHIIVDVINNNSHEIQKSVACTLKAFEYNAHSLELPSIEKENSK